jgi:hypothetical protein
MSNSPNLINCFRPGQHRAADGLVYEFSAERCRRAAEIYDPALHHAPIIIGHGGLEAPAYGHVKSFSVSADGMEAEPEGMDAEFAGLVNREAYPNVSLGWFGPDHPRNPLPGEWYPAELSFLGAVPPAVRNLRKPKFAAFAGFAAADAAAIVRFGSEWDDVTNAGLWRRFRDWMIGKFGLDEADKVVPSWDVQSLEQAAQDELRESQTDVPPLPAFAGPTIRPESTVTEAEAAQLRAENEQLKRERNEDRAREAKRAEDARRDEFAAFASTLASPDQDGKVRLAPTHVKLVTDVLMAVSRPGADGQTVNFSSEDGSTRPLVDAFKAALSAGPGLVTFGQTATMDRAAPPGNKNPLVADAERRANAAKG